MRFKKPVQFYDSWIKILLINHTYTLQEKKNGPAMAMTYYKYKAGTGILFGDVCNVNGTSLNSSDVILF